jgi:hypothetical protein
VTTALDRIERAGYATRVWDQQDRRTVRVEMTDAAKREVEVVYGPLAKEGGQLLQKYAHGNWWRYCGISKTAGNSNARTRSKSRAR